MINDTETSDSVEESKTEENMSLDLSNTANLLTGIHRDFDGDAFLSEIEMNAEFSDMDSFDYQENSVELDQTIQNNADSNRERRNVRSQEEYLADRFDRHAGYQRVDLLNKINSKIKVKELPILKLGVTVRYWVRSNDMVGL